MSTSPLLQLPREVRDKILFHLFFQDHAEAFAPSMHGKRQTVVTTCPNITLLKLPPFEHEKPPSPPLHFDVSLLRTCRQLQQEGEHMLYSNLKFNTWTGEMYETSRPVFLEKLGPSQLGLIRHLQIPDINFAEFQFPFCEWEYMTRIIGKHCVSLQSLEIGIFEVGPFSREERSTNVFLQREWLQPLLQIGGLQDLVVTFAVHADQNLANEADEPSMLETELVPWLKSQLASERPIQSSLLPPNSSPGTPFPFLDLPTKLQRQILRLAVLPPTKLFHPCVKPSLDATTQNILPLLLTNRLISKQVESIIYGEAAFTACEVKHHRDFKDFLRHRTPRQQSLMKRLCCKGLDVWSDRSFAKFMRAKFPALADQSMDIWGIIHPCFYTHPAAAENMVSSFDA